MQTTAFNDVITSSKEYKHVKRLYRLARKDQKLFEDRLERLRAKEEKLLQQIAENELAMQNYHTQIAIYEEII